MQLPPRHRTSAFGHQVHLAGGALCNGLLYDGGLTINGTMGHVNT